MEISAWMVRHGLRTLTRTPGLAIAIVLILALGIGANSAVFAALQVVLLQPLPFPEADRLVRVTQRQERSAETFIAPVRLEDWNRRTATFQSITGYFVEDVSETSGDFPERVRRAFVAPRFLETWRVAPLLGRAFTTTEHRLGGPRAALISERYWRARFNGDPNALNGLIRVAGLSFPIVGIMPASFLFPDRDVDLWFPSPVDAPYAQARYATWYVGIGRVRSGVTLEQARLDLAAVQARLGEEYPQTDRALGVDVVPLKETVVSRFRGSLWLLFAAVTALLLIACTNIAALLLARSLQRQKEVSIRFALGASRRSVIAQMLIETGMLAVPGALAGLVIATQALALFRRAGPDLPRLNEISLNPQFFLYTLSCAVGVTLICGVLPAVRSTRDGVANGLAYASRTSVSTRHSLQWLLVSVQVSLSVALLTVAGLLVRSFQELSRVSPGFDASHVLTFRVSANYAESADMARLVARVEREIDELHALPGVEEVATSSTMPGVPFAFDTTFTIVDGPATTETLLTAENRFVSPSYFATLKIPVLSGELCRRQPLSAGRQILVNATFASRYFPGQSAIGHQLIGPNYVAPGTIIGIVGDAHERGIDREAAAALYWCMSASNPMPSFLIRARGDEAALAPLVRQKIKEIEPGRAVYDVQPLVQRIGDAYAQNRLRAVLVASFALTALSLACVGLYGTLSYIKRLRRREVGLRLALGANRGTIVRQIVSTGLQIVALSCAAGLALFLASARALSGMLYGVSSSDPATASLVVVLVIAVAGVASIVPAARVAGVDPMKVLREE